MNRGKNRRTKAELVAEVGELQAKVRYLEGEEEGFWVVESAFEGTQTFPDTSGQDKADLVIPPFHKVAIEEYWVHDPSLRRAIAAGRLRGPFLEKERPMPPVPVEVPLELRLTNSADEGFVRLLLVRPVSEFRDRLDIAPKSHTGRLDVRYLKDTHLPRLKNALYRAERGEARPEHAKELIKALKKRIGEIQSL